MPISELSVGFESHNHTFLEHVKANPTKDGFCTPAADTVPWRNGMYCVIATYQLKFAFELDGNDRFRRLPSGLVSTSRRGPQAYRLPAWMSIWGWRARSCSQREILRNL